MLHVLNRLPLLACCLLWVISSAAQEKAPWGKSSLQEIDYAPQKVLYDVAVSDVETFTHVLDRVSYLNKLYNANPFNASIVLVMHGNEIPFFSIDDYAQYQELMRRAQSLTVAGPVEFRMCAIAASGHGLKPGEVHGFVKMVPMADAEIVRLQQDEGYVYMR